MLLQQYYAETNGESTQLGSYAYSPHDQIHDMNTTEDTLLDSLPLSSNDNPGIFQAHQ
jgi:hypothetical protein